MPDDTATSSWKRFTDKSERTAGRALPRITSREFFSALFCKTGTAPAEWA